MKVSELRNLSSEDLKRKEIDAKKELFTLQYQRKIGQVEKPARFRVLKRDIAKILTILKERDLEHERDGSKTK